MSTTLYILELAGALLSCYALYCSVQIRRDSSFKSVCDLTESASCSKAFRSEYGSHFGIPNGVFGIAFYGLLAILTFLQETQLLLVFSSLSIVASAYLGFVLATKVRAICLDCIAVYSINLAIFGILLWPMLH